jgi:succinate dehydrogenase/fumarate reductase flavoprotein subunit
LNEADSYHLWWLGRIQKKNKAAGRTLEKTRQKEDHMGTAQDREANVSRRGFLKGAAWAVAGSATVGLTACSPAPTAESSGSITWDKEADVVIIGGGNGGLSAAAAAADGGKKVILLEVSAFCGGGSAYSGGILHSLGQKTYEDWEKYCEGLTNPVLAKAYIDTLHNEYIPFLEDNSIPLSKLPDDGKFYLSDWRLGSGEERYLAHKAYFDALANMIASKNGEILTKTRGVSLYTNAENGVIGVRAQSTSDDSWLNIKASAVVLATGGFQGNKGLMARYMGPYADTCRNQGTPYNTGSGMMMAEAIGALTAGSFATFSGTFSAFCNVIPTEDNPAEWEEKRAGDPATLPGLGWGRPSPPWIHATFADENKGIIINLDGKRYIDESSTIDSKYARLPQSILSQKRGRVIIVGDQAIYDSVQSSGTSLQAIEEQNGIVVKGNTLEDFAQKLQNTCGVNRANVIKTIMDYNAAIEAGTADQLEVPRVDCLFALATPPYYGILTVPNVYHVFGGLAINENAQVLNLNRDPISGLYATPPCAGDVFREVYGGGIASAGTFGYIAGKHIAANA